MKQTARELLNPETLLKVTRGQWPHRDHRPAAKSAINHPTMKTHLVKLVVSVGGDILVQRGLLQLGQKVPRHAEQEDTVVEGEGGSTAACYGDARTHDVPQVWRTGILLIIKAERAIASEALVAQYGRQQDVCGRLWTRTCLAQSA